MPFDSLAGPTTAPSGLEAVPVNPSVPAASTTASTTLAISGPSGSHSSASAALQSFLESRLPQHCPGTTLFRETWKRKTTPAGRPLLAHTASGHRTCDNDCIGWPTPNAGPQNDTDTTWQARRAELKAQHKNGNGFGMTLGMATQLTHWASPMAQDWRNDNLSDEAYQRRWSHRRGKPLSSQVCGLLRTGSPAEMVSQGQLNPTHSRWLMGYPPAWDACAATATPSSRKSRRCLSKPTVKPKQTD